MNRRFLLAMVFLTVAGCTDESPVVLDGCDTHDFASDSFTLPAGGELRTSFAICRSQPWRGVEWSLYLARANGVAFWDQNVFNQTVPGPTSMTASETTRFPVAVRFPADLRGAYHLGLAWRGEVEQDDRWVAVGFPVNGAAGWPIRLG